MFNHFQNFTVKNYCLSYKCHDTSSENKHNTENYDYDYENHQEWGIELKACICLDEKEGTPGRKFIDSLVARVNPSIRCCGKSHSKNKNCIEKSGIIVDGLGECEANDLTDELIRVKPGVSFAKSTTKINIPSDLVNIIRSHGHRYVELDKNVFDDQNVCIGPAWIKNDEAAKEKFKNEPLQLRYFSCMPPCNGTTPCVRYDSHTNKNFLVSLGSPNRLWPKI